MKRSKAIETHRNIIALHEKYITFIEHVPQNKLISLVCHTYGYPYFIGRKKRGIEVICEVIGFNKNSIRVNVVAAEVLFYPFTDMVKKEACHNMQGESKNIISSHIKFDNIKDFKWTEVDKKDLPLYVEFEFKTVLYDQLLSGVTDE